MNNDDKESVFSRFMRWLHRVLYCSRGYHDYFQPWLWEPCPFWVCRMCDYYRDDTGTDGDPKSFNVVVDTDDLPHTCGTCGARLQIVRPGKWQCPECE